jgi:hypothetical protein
VVGLLSLKKKEPLGKKEITILKKERTPGEERNYNS